MGDLGTQRRDQDPARHRRCPVCADGQALFEQSRRRRRRLPGTGRAPRRSFAVRPESLDSGQQVEDRLESCWPMMYARRCAAYGPRELVIAHRLPDLRRSPRAASSQLLLRR